MYVLKLKGSNKYFQRFSALGFSCCIADVDRAKKFSTLAEVMFYYLDNSLKQYSIYEVDENGNEFLTFK
jgi:hypothetical protein